MSQYDERCSNCDEQLTEDTHIFCFSRGDEEETFCGECGEDLADEMRADGWKRDDDEEEQKPIDTCPACNTKKVKTGCCGYCHIDLCEECCRPDCEWNDEGLEDLCCMYCWLEDAAEGMELADLVKAHRAKKPAPRKFILKLKGGKVISKTELK